MRLMHGSDNAQAQELIGVVVELVELGVYIAPAVGVTTGVIPGHIVVGVGVERGLVYAWRIIAEDMGEIVLQKSPVEIVGLAAVGAFHDKTTYTRWFQYSLEAVEAAKVVHELGTLGLGKWVMSFPSGQVPVRVVWEWVLWLVLHVSSVTFTRRLRYGCRVPHHRSDYPRFRADVAHSRVR